LSRFRKPVQVIRRRQGEYVRGVWTPAQEPEPDTVLLGIQPATAADYQQVEANPEGRRLGSMLRAYGPVENPLTAAGENERNGDLVLYRGAYWLVIGAHVRDTLGRPVSHIRYLLAQEIEHGDGEVVS
jgi:hypothetical protein